MSSVKEVFNKYLTLISESQLESDQITEELNEFVTRKGFSIKKPRKCKIKMQHKANLEDLLIHLSKSVIKEKIEPTNAIEEMLIACLYFIETDYDSPSLRIQEIKTWDKQKKISLKRLGNIDDYKNLRERISKRAKWMEEREKLISGDFGYREDRRDLHGILRLNFILGKFFDLTNSPRLLPFVSSEKLSNQHQTDGTLKINNVLVICHLMYFLGIDKNEESIRQIIMNYYDEVSQESDFSKFQELNKEEFEKVIINYSHPGYLPQHLPLIWSERILWEKVYFAEKNKTTTPIDTTIPIEWLITYFWRGSLISFLKNIDQQLLLSYVKEKFAIDHNIEPEIVFFWFEYNTDMRTS